MKKHFAALISDSHGSLDRLTDLLENLEEAGVRRIVHAGDFLVDGVVEIFEQHPDLQIWIARGNCDVNAELLVEVRKLPNIQIDEILEFEIEGVKIAAAHRVKDLSKSGAEILVSGHTHVPRIKKSGSQLWLNPGSLMDDGGYFLLDLENREVERKIFNEKIIDNLNLK